MDCRTPGFPVLHYLPEFAQTHVCLESMMPPNHLILCHPFSSCPQSFPAPGSFLMTQFFVSGGQGIGASASASLLPMNIQGWFPLGLTGLNSLLSSSVQFSHSVMSSSLWPHGWAGKESACNAWDLGSIPGLGRSAGERKGYPLQYSGWIPWTTFHKQLAVQGTFKSLLQHHSLKISILRRLAFFMVQLSYPDMITGKPIALTIQTCVSKVMSLLFNMLSRSVIAFLPRVEATNLNSQMLAIRRG